MYQRNYIKHENDINTIFSHTEKLQFNIVHSDPDVATFELLFNIKNHHSIKFNKVIFNTNLNVTDFTKIINEGKILFYLEYEPICIFNFSLLLKLQNIIMQNNSYIITIPSDWTLETIHSNQCHKNFDMIVRIEIPFTQKINNITNVNLSLINYVSDAFNRSFIDPITQLK